MARRKKVKEAFQEHGQFFAMPHIILDHPDYLSLTHAAKDLLFIIGRYYNGSNNGDISIPFSDLKKRGFKSKSHLKRCQDELIAHGLIVKTRQGEKRKCSLFALSWKELSVDQTKVDINIKLWRPRSFKQQ